LSFFLVYLPKTPPMKRILLIASLVAPALAFAQQGTSDANIQKQGTNIIEPTRVEPFKSTNTPTNNGFQRKSGGNLPYKLDTLGFTFYDLQTNASIGNRVLVHSDGKVSAVWTYSPDNTTEFPLRGSAYNHFNGTSWGAEPTSRIENNQRLGWPSIGVLPGNKEYVIAHYATSGGMNVITNNAIGGTTWTTGPRVLTATGGKPIWNRAANNGNTIHLICNYSDSAASTDPPNISVDGVLLPTTYSRSTDGGATWSTALSLLPGYDTTRYLRGGGDQYAIDVKGNNVAILIGDNLGGDVALWKSTDNGVTFTKTIIDTFEFAPYTSDKVIGSNIPTNDGSVEVSLDANGNVHAFWGYSEVTKTDPSPDSSFFVPASNRIMYWNEQTNTKKIIGGMVDMDGDDSLTIAPGTTRSLNGTALPRILNANGDIIDILSVARYGNTSLATMPSATVDAQGRIFCIYSAPLEGDVYLGDVTASSNYRDVFITFSTDNGATWADPQNISQGHGYEDVFGCVGKLVVNDVLHVIWQRDEIPGTNLQNNSADNSHPTVNNVIVHSAIPVQAIINNQIGLGPGVGIKPVEKQNVYITSGFYPNPTSNGGEVEIYLTETSPVTLTVSNLLGQTVATQDLGKTAPGNTTINVSTENLASGVYMYSISTGKYLVSGKMIVNK
jgi:hypothetical protein